MDNWVHALTVYNGELIAGGQFTSAGGVPANYIAKWNGYSWSPLGSGTNAEVDALTVFNGKLIAGGRFTSRRSDVNFIAQWDGTNWNDDLGGVGSIVAALTVYNNRIVAGGYFVEADGTPAHLTVLNNELYAGGLFETAGGITANGIAKWNGTTWSDLNGGLYYGGSNAYGAFAVTNYANKVIAGGLFTTAGGVGVAHIAQWEFLKQEQSM
ncbi:MAG: hypothetical protein IPL53_19630 [Ignavibacteria bacterium]|nr:hypothetical protein [Ignavibacteria bacterium]